MDGKSIDFHGSDSLIFSNVTAFLQKAAGKFLGLLLKTIKTFITMDKSNYYEKGLLDQGYPSNKPGELIVIYEDDFPMDECGCVERAIKKEDDNAVRQKTKNNKKVELWKAENIQSDIHIDRVVATLGSNTTHSEKVKFCFDYTNSFPVDEFVSINPSELKPNDAVSGLDGKNKIIIAVLDTGVDFDLIPKEYLWSTVDKDVNGGNPIYGKNF